jgi:hypothetical protein
MNKLIVAGGLALAIPAAANAANILSIDHDGTAGDENNPFDTRIFDGTSDWTATTDGPRSIITALDNSTGGSNRLIVAGANGLSAFNSGGGPAGKGYVFEIELEFLQGDSKAGGGFAYFGVRSENDTGKQAWITLSEDGGTGGNGQIGFSNSNNNFYTTGSLTPVDLDVDSLIGDGQYHNFKIYKYDKAGTTVVEVYMDGGFLFGADYADLDDDLNVVDVQGFASSTPTPLSQVNVDFINFDLYDNLTESAVPEPGSLALLGLGGLLIARRRR